MCVCLSLLIEAVPKLDFGGFIEKGNKNINVRRYLESLETGPILDLFGSSEIRGPGQHFCQICSLNHKK